MSDLIIPTIILFYDKHEGETMKIFEQIKVSLNNKAVLVHLNVKGHPASFATFKVVELPCFVAFLNGKELWRVSGIFTVETILQNFENISF
jgi:thioredoxin-like negative regulator of GroEL